MKSAVKRCFTIFAITLLAGTAFANVPAAVYYQGYLTDDSGYPVTGSLDMEFNIYTASPPGTPIWTETWNAGTSQVIVTDGYYSVPLGVYSSLGTLFEQNTELWLEITVGGETLSPAKRIASAGYAIHARDAETLDGEDSTDFWKKTDSVDADTLDGQDSTAFAGSAHSHSFSEITGQVTDAQVPNNITINYALIAGNVPWGGIANMPSGFSDGTDDVGITTESDPTVPANVKDGVDFSELSGTATDAQVPDDITIDYSVASGSVPWSGITSMPSDFADNTDDTGLLCTRITQADIPYYIATPGYYCLAENITSTGTTPIIIDSGQVVLDLKGFTMTGTGASNEKGIYVYEEWNVRIQNGTITGFGNSGIIVAMSRDTKIFNIDVYSCGATDTASGIYITFGLSIVKDCNFSDNAKDGLGSHSSAKIQISDSTMSNNGENGVTLGLKSMITNCMINNNGHDGIWASSGCIIKDCVVSENTEHGINTYGSGVIQGCSAFENGLDGINSGGNGTVVNNSSNYNGNHGFRASGSTLFKQNTATYNDMHGFSLGTSCLVNDNVSVNNNRSFGGYLNYSTCATCTFGTNVDG